MIGVGLVMKKQDGYLLFLVIIFGGIALMFERSGQIPFAAAAVVIIGLFFVFSRLLQRKKQREARDQLARMVFRNQIAREGGKS